MKSGGALSPQPLGQRIGVLRAQRGWTQADLAVRLAVSRVAVSHFEMGLAVPSERTILLLAGWFKLTPGELVEGTDYPLPKRERLPSNTLRYTEVEMELALLRRDLEWLAEIESRAERQRMAAELSARWGPRFGVLEGCAAEVRERDLLKEAARDLQRVISQALAPKPAPSARDR